MTSDQIKNAIEKWKSIKTYFCDKFCFSVFFFWLFAILTEGMTKLSL